MSARYAMTQDELAAFRAGKVIGRDEAQREAEAEVARLSALVADMHAAAVGETRPPLLGLVEDVAATRSALAAQQQRAANLDGIAREMAARVAELEDAAKAPTELTVWRAAFEDGIALGHYANRQAAMDHVHATLANEEGGDVTTRVIWRADDPKADEPEWECWLFDTDMADDTPTGYIVTPLTVAAAYDPEADA